jgi:hypothetical protein
MMATRLSWLLGRRAQRRRVRDGLQHLRRLKVSRRWGRLLRRDRPWGRLLDRLWGRLRVRYDGQLEGVLQRSGERHRVVFPLAVLCHQTITANRLPIIDARAPTPVGTRHY